MISKQQAREWVEALRSGEYEQGRTYLHDSTAGTYCCLGVLSEAMGASYSETRREFVFREAVVTGLSRSSLTVPSCWLPNDVQTRLVGLNDVKRKSFDEIADYIESEIIPQLPDEEVESE